MAKYTLELRTIIEDPYAPYLFNFDYEFYDNDLKSIFENKFMEYYYFDEIGFPTIQRFKHNLKSKLNMIMPYYKKLYETELSSKDINFLLNKDLKETFIREVEQNSSLENVTNTFGTNEGNSLGYQADTPQSKLSLDIERYASSANKDTNSTNYNDNSNTNSNQNSQGNEKTELISQGNIGTTSSAELLEKWRKVLINIDEMIINDLQDLFMQVY